MKSLIRLIPCLQRYRYQLLAGFAAFFMARLFEVSTYYLVSVGIDQIDLLSTPAATARLPSSYWLPALSHFTVGQLALALMACVALRFVFVVHARRQVRRVGQFVAFDLRQRLYAAVQGQGSDFFARMGVGDIMTRAIQDISLIQRLVAFGSIQIVIMVYAPCLASPP